MLRPAQRTHQPKLQHRRFTHYRTATPKSPHWLQWGDPYSPPKLPLPVDQSANCNICPISAPMQATYHPRRHPDPISPFPTMHWTNRQRDTQTYRWLPGKLDNYKPNIDNVQQQRSLIIMKQSLISVCSARDFVFDRLRQLLSAPCLKHAGTPGRRRDSRCTK